MVSYYSIFKKKTDPLYKSSFCFPFFKVLWELLTHEVPFNGIEGFQVAWLVVERGEVSLAAL